MMEPKGQVLDIVESNHSMLPMDRVWAIPRPSMAMPWAGNTLASKDIDDTLSQGHDIVSLVAHEALEHSLHNLGQSHKDSEKHCQLSNTQISSNSPIPFETFWRPADILMHGETPENETVNAILAPSLQSIKDLYSQQYDSALNVPISRKAPAASSLPLPFSSEVCSSQDVMITPPSYSYQKGSFAAEHSPAKVSCSFTRFSESSLTHVGNQRYRRNETRQKTKQFSQPEVTPSSHTAGPRVNSRAVEMIIDVEKLYLFGVSVGILPEDTTMRLSLKKMKLSFMSLLPPISGEDHYRSTDESSKDDGDNR
jgi:hypothetical protein